MVISSERLPTGSVRAAAETKITFFRNSSAGRVRFGIVFARCRFPEFRIRNFQYLYPDASFVDLYFAGLCRSADRGGGGSCRFWGCGAVAGGDDSARRRLSDGRRCLCGRGGASFSGRGGGGGRCLFGRAVRRADGNLRSALFLADGDAPGIAESGISIDGSFSDLSGTGFCGPVIRRVADVVVRECLRSGGRRFAGRRRVCLRLTSCRDLIHLSLFEL